MSDLITRVAEVIERQMMQVGGFRYEGDPGSYHPAIEEISAEVIVEVRAADVERGPSEAEVDLGAFKDALREYRNGVLRSDSESYRAAKEGMALEQVMYQRLIGLFVAAAHVRQEEAE